MSAHKPEPKPPGRKKRQTEPIVDFVVQRAFRSAERRATRKDVVEAFALHPNTASAMLSLAVESNGDCLRREGYSVVPIPGAPMPASAGEASLAERLSEGRWSFAEIGLRAEELPINRFRWAELLPLAPGALTLIVDAIARKGPVDIQYVSMKSGDLGVWRRIVPVSLDDVNGQWRVFGHDITSVNSASSPEGENTRSFVLSRVIAAKVCVDPLPKRFSRANPFDSRLPMEVQLSPRLTEPQRRVIANELGGKVDDAGLMTSTLNFRTQYDFRTRYAGQMASGEVIWPPVVSFTIKGVTHPVER